MSESITPRAARAIMNGRFVSDVTDVPVPLSRAELIDAYNRGFSLYFIPEGSFATFPEGLEPAHHPIDVGCERPPSWIRETRGHAYVLAYPRLYSGTAMLSLADQENIVRPFSILTPYELACMAACAKKLGNAPLFEGQARTTAECGFSTSHLQTSPFTAIASYDGAGRMRFSRGYASQVSPELGVVVGIRRFVV